MRKTVTIDDEVVKMLELEVKRSGESRKAAINRLLLAGLNVIRSVPPAGKIEANSELIRGLKGIPKHLGLD